MRKDAYYIGSYALNDKSRASSQEFRKFTESGDTTFLQLAGDYLLSAIDYAENFSDNFVVRTDKANLLRKYASIVVRDSTYPQRNELAKEALLESLTIFKSVRSDPIIDIEIQRVLVQLRKIAYDLRDGELLQFTVDQSEFVIKMVAFFQLEYFESKYILAFSRKDFREAKFYAEKLIRYDNNNPTCYRHLAKVFLGILQYELLHLSDKSKLEYLVKYVESNFWKSYDKNKQLYENNPNDRNTFKRLEKDLIFLFMMRCKKSLLCDFFSTPRKYVIKEAKKYLNTSDIAVIREKLRIKEKICIESGELCMDYKYTGECPVLSFTKEEINRLFNHDRSSRYSFLPPPDGTSNEVDDSKLNMEKLDLSDSNPTLST